MIRKLLTVTGILFLTLVLSLQVCFFLILAGGNLNGKDFINYYFGARIIREGNTKYLYNTDIQQFYQNRTLGSNSKRLLPFRALPVLGTIYIPFSLFESKVAYTLFTGLLLLSIGVSLFLIKRKYKISPAILITVCLIEPMLIWNLIQGQPSILFFMTLIGSLLLLKSSRFLVAGLLLSLLFLKFQFFPVALVFAVLVNNKKFLFGFLSGTLFLALLNITIYGSSLFYDYLKFLVFTEKPIFGSHLFITYTFKGMLDFAGILFHFGTNPWFLVFNSVLFCCLAGFLFIKRKNIVGSLEDKLFFSIFSGLLLGIHVINHDLIFIMLPLIFLFKDCQLNKYKSIFPLVLLGLIPLLEYLDIRLTLVSILLMLYFVAFYGQRIGLTSSR